MRELRFHPKTRYVSGFGGRGAAKFGIPDATRRGAVEDRHFRQFSGNSGAESHHVAAPHSQLSTEPGALPTLVGARRLRGAGARG
jgi:hypothetical protein